MTTKAVIKGLSLLLLIFFLNGCESSDNKSIEAPGASMKSELAQRKTNPYLSYEHSLSVELEKAALATKFKALTDQCSADRENNCTLLETDFSGGSYTYARIKLRVAPTGVEKILALAGDNGKITNEMTTVEDLSTQIFDTEKRIKLLQTYQNDLLDLQKQAKGNIDSLIKVSQEIASVQSQLEELSGSSQALMQRVNMDIINIRLSSRNEKAFWTPISDALDEFKGNLAEGIAGAITGVAYLIPWLIVLIVIFFISRFIWRRIKRK